MLAVRFSEEAFSRAEKLMKLFYEKTNEHNIMNNINEIFDYLHEFPNYETTKQTKLF